MAYPPPVPCLVPPLPRGVSVARYVGPDNEVVLQAITSRAQKLAEVVVPWGVNRLDVEAELVRWLDVADPTSSIVPRRRAPGATRI